MLRRGCASSVSVSTSPQAAAAAFGKKQENPSFYFAEPLRRVIRQYGCYHRASPCSLCEHDYRQSEGRRGRLCVPAKAERNMTTSIAPHSHASQQSSRVLTRTATSEWAGLCSVDARMRHVHRIQSRCPFDFDPDGLSNNGSKGEAPSPSAGSIGRRTARAICSTTAASAHGFDAVQADSSFMSDFDSDRSTAQHTLASITTWVSEL